MVDSTSITAQSSTKNAEKKRDSDARSVKKGNQWHSGYKAHIGVDKDTGLVHTIKATSANEHDVAVTSQLLHGEEKEVYGDSGYIGAETRAEAIIRNKSGKKIKYKINHNPSSIKKLSTSGQYYAKVEHVFGIVKRQLGYRRTRYRGLKKQTSKLNIMFALANLILADRKALAV